MKICIDPGHSGTYEPGACAAGYSEAAVTMAVSNLVKSYLEDEGHTVVLTRVGDIEDDGLQFRADIANKAGADIFVCIHCNSASNTSAVGTESYIFDSSCKESETLAMCIDEHITQALKTRNRGIKTANFCVLRETNMPAVLVELAFISNDTERAKLVSPESQKDFATAIKAGILAWDKEYNQ